MSSVPPPRNPDRVARPVAAAAVVGVLVAAFLRASADGIIDEGDLSALQAPLWDAFQAVVVPLVPAVLAWLAARRARGRVTPVLVDQGDVPRDLQGRRLAPVIEPAPPTEHTAPPGGPRRRPRRDR